MRLRVSDFEMALCAISNQNRAEVRKWAVGRGPEDDGLQRSARSVALAEGVQRARTIRDRLTPTAAEVNAQNRFTFRHCHSDRHAIARTDLRGGTVKARRPRTCAVAAKRRALHGAEHRSSIECVMVGTRNAVQIVWQVEHSNAPDHRARRSGFIRLPYRAPNGRAMVTRCSARSGSDCPDKYRHDSATSSATINAARGLTQRLRRTHTDTRSHGVSDPSGQARGDEGRARRGRSRHGYLL